MKISYTFVSVLGTLLPFVASADIASKSYVDSGDDAVMATVGEYENGNWNTNSNDTTITDAINAIKNTIGDGFNESNTVADALSQKSTLSADANSAIITDASGKMVGFQINTQKIKDDAVTSGKIATQSITNDKIANNAQIDLSKIKFPTGCNDAKCMLIYKGGVNQYVFEPIEYIAEAIPVIMRVDFSADAIDGGYSEQGYFGNIQEENCSDCTPGEWWVEFSYGTIHGTAGCSKLSGTNWETTYPADKISQNEQSGGYCFCRITSVNATDLPESKWWLESNFGATNCPDNCTHTCAEYLAYNYSNKTRSAMYSAANIGNIEN